MDKRYQVFVSSTYLDLVDARRHVIQTLMEMDCIPAGMEIFPALDEEQWKFIRRVIDDCDYYVLVMGGRYGSVTAEGVSYTEKEYDYAVEKAIPVLAFVHGAPDEIPVGKVDLDHAAREKLKAFRQKVTAGRLIRTWTKVEELPGLVAVGLQKTIRSYPAVGWVRANLVANSELLEQINAVRQENERLKEQHATASAVIKAQLDHNVRDDLSRGADVLTVHGYYFSTGRKISWSRQISWDDVFRLIGPIVMQSMNKAATKVTFQRYLKEKFKLEMTDLYLEDYDFDTILLQLSGLGLITVTESRTVGGGTGLFIRITESGLAYLASLRAIRRPNEAIPVQ